MALLDQVVTVNITATTATLSVPGTDIPAVMAYHTHNTDLIRTYTDLPSMVTDGFATTEPAYLLAQSICEQNPRPSTFKVIRATTGVAQHSTFTVTDNTNGHTVGVTLTSSLGVTTACYHTVSSESTDAVATAVALLIDALSDIASTASGSVVTNVAGTAAKIWYVSDVRGGTWLDTTTTAAPNTDLDAVVLVDNDWYGISGSWLDVTNIGLIAAWAETNKKAHTYTTADSNVLTADEAGVFDVLQDLAYTRSMGLYSAEPIGYGATGWLARGLTFFPGAYNFAYKTVTGDVVDALTSTQQTNINATNGNFYSPLAGVSVALYGVAASGQFMDLQIGIDGLRNDIQTSVGNLLISVPKLPYTRKGMAAVQGAVAGALQRAVIGGFLSNDAGFEYSVTIPDLSGVSSADKAARILRNVNFTCTAQGAINKTVINGTVSV